MDALNTQRLQTFKGWKIAKAPWGEWHGTYQTHPNLQTVYTPTFPTRMDLLRHIYTLEKTLDAIIEEILDEERAEKEKS